MSALGVENQRVDASQDRSDVMVVLQDRERHVERPLRARTKRFGRRRSHAVRRCCFSMLDGNPFSSLRRLAGIWSSTSAAGQPMR